MSGQIPGLTRRTSSQRGEQEDLIDSHPFLCLEGWVVKRLRSLEGSCLPMEIARYPTAWQEQMRKQQRSMYVKRLQRGSLDAGIGDFNNERPSPFRRAHYLDIHEDDEATEPGQCQDTASAAGIAHWELGRPATDVCRIYCVETLRPALQNHVNLYEIQSNLRGTYLGDARSDEGTIARSRRSMSFLASRKIGLFEGTRDFLIKAVLDECRARLCVHGSTPTG